MSIRLNNSFFRVRDASFALFKPESAPLSLGQIFRVVNIGGTAGSLSYTAIDGSTASTGNLTTGQIAYILAVSGSMSDGYPVGTGGLLARTNLLITSSIITPPTFTEVLITTTGAGTWTKPAGVTEVIVECWGGGGSGGGATANPAAGSGAAGGQYARKFVQYSSPSVGISYSVAATRAGGTGNGTVGNDTTWDTTVVVAKGGAGGLADGEPGAEVAGGVGSITSGIGDVVYAGVSGGSSFAGNPFNQGGAGGASAGSVGNGTTVELGGLGGDAAAFTSANGGAGNNYGAGGGGAYTNISTNRSGGTGAQGLIRLIYR